MTISQRLRLLVAAALMSLLVLTGINYQQMNQVFDETNYVSVNVVPSIELLNKVSVEFGRLRVRIYRHAISSPEEKTEIEKTITDSQTKLNQHLKDYENFISNAEDRRLLDEERKAVAELNQQLDGALAVSRANRLDDVKAELKRIAPYSQKFIEHVEAHIKFNKKLDKKNVKHTIQVKNQAT